MSQPHGAMNRERQSDLLQSQQSKVSRFQPNLKQLNDLAHEVSCNIIASGGVAVLKDIINLAELDVYGAICGKAIYTGSLDLKQAIEVTNKI